MDNEIKNKKRYCPMCRTELVLKVDDILFCPSCKIYIGRQDTFHVHFGPNSHYFHQEFETIHFKEKEETVRRVFLNYIIIFIAIVAILFVSMEVFYKPYVLSVQKQGELNLDKNN